MFRNSVIHQIFSEHLQPFSGMSEFNGSPVLDRGLRFYLVLDSSRSFLSTCSLNTDTGLESIPHGSSRALVLLLLDTVMVGEVDEVEEDVG